jgi:hypothetical protein
VIDHVELRVRGVCTHVPVHPAPRRPPGALRSSSRSPARAARIGDGFDHSAQVHSYPVRPTSRLCRARYYVVQSDTAHCGRARQPAAGSGRAGSRNLGEPVCVGLDTARNSAAPRPASPHQVGELDADALILRAGSQVVRHGRSSEVRSSSARSSASACAASEPGDAAHLP